MLSHAEQLKSEKREGEHEIILVRLYVTLCNDDHDDDDDYDESRAVDQGVEPVGYLRYPGGFIFFFFRGRGVSKACELADAYCGTGETKKVPKKQLKTKKNKEKKSLTSKKK